MLRANQDACKYCPLPPRRIQKVSTKVYPGCTEDGFTVHLSPFRPSIQAWGPRSPGDGGGGGQCTLQASLFLLPSLASRFSFRTKAWEESGERRSAENRKRPEGGGVREKMATYIMCGFWIMPLGECQRNKALSHKCLEPSRFCFLRILPARRVASFAFFDLRCPRTAHSSALSTENTATSPALHLQVPTCDTLDPTASSTLQIPHLLHFSRTSSKLPHDAQAQVLAPLAEYTCLVVTC